MASGKIENRHSDYQMSSKKALVILAGGLGSRYKSLKQIDGITDNQSPLLEYSLYDAMEAGFSKIILIINKLIPASYIDRLQQIALKKNLDLRFVYQHIENFVPQDIDLSFRKKPWGTAHALLCIKNEIEENFIILNADDFYGKEAFKMASEIINQNLVKTNLHHIIAYPLDLTLSENGAVSRGICDINKQQSLTKITERTHIFSDLGKIYFIENDKKISLEPKTLVSMNFSIFNPSIFDDLEDRFHQFVKTNQNPKAEFYIPQLIEDLLQENKISVKVHESPSQWMGVTYPEDKQSLKSFIETKIKDGDYPENLWN